MLSFQMPENSGVHTGGTQTLYYHGELSPGTQLPVSWCSLANLELASRLLFRLSFAGFPEF